MKKSKPRSWERLFGRTACVALLGAVLLTLPGCFENYDSNDLAVADLDGDGSLDFVLARRQRSFSDDSSESDVTFVRQDPAQARKWRRLDSRRTGRNPQQVAVIDLDLDGRSEVLTINKGSSNLAIFFADPDRPGYYLQPARLPVGRRPIGFAVEDLDGDGFVDLAIANDESTAFSLLFQNDAAPGSFVGEVQIEIGERQKAIEAVDIDGDRLVDIVVATRTSVLLLRQDPVGNGVFLPPTVLLEDAKPSTVAAGDLNGDMRPDLAIGDRKGKKGQLHILLQDPVVAGTFTLGQTLPTVERAMKVAIGPIDGDTRLDLAVASFRARGNRDDRGWVSVFLAEPTLPGEFFESGRYKVNGKTDSPHIVDIDRDGAIDIAVASDGARALYGIPGSPGEFEEPRLLKR